jgi:hypothetical protein
MHELEHRNRLPNLDRLSALAAIILMAYTLARFVVLPERQLDLQLPGMYLALRLKTSTLLSLIVAGLTISGTRWLLQDHPALGKHSTLEHWLLPGLTAGVIELPLSQLPLSPLWWIGFALGGALIIFVLIAEYIAIDPDDAREPPAAAVLIILSYALFLVLAASLRFSQTRLFFLLPVLGLACFLVSLRNLRLRLHGQWAIIPSLLVALITTQIAAALHYWPLPPVAFGLAVVGPAYSLTSLLGNLSEGEPLQYAVVEPAIILTLVWIAAIWML